MNVALSTIKGIEESSTLQLCNVIYKNELKTIQNNERKQKVKENNSETVEDKIRNFILTQDT